MQKNGGNTQTIENPDLGQKLRNPENQFVRSLIESGPDPMVTIRLDGVILFVNDAMAKFTGVPKDEMIGADGTQYFAEPEKSREGYMKAAREGAVVDYLLTMKHRDGRLIDVLFNASAVKDEKGRVAGVFAVCRDTTAQKQSAQYARSVIEASLDSMITIDPDGKITDVNESTARMTGIPRDRMIGTDYVGYFTEPEKARQSVRRVFGEGKITNLSLTVRHVDGQLTELSVNSTVYRDVQGNVAGVFAAGRDVTNLNKVMREFRDTKNFLNNILQSSIRYSIVGIDSNRRIIWWNEGARLLYGYASYDMFGWSIDVLHDPEDIQSGAVEALMREALAKGLAERECKQVRMDGSRFVASVVVTRRNDDAGQPVGFLVMSSDISEKKHAEEQRWQTSKYTRGLIESLPDPLVAIGMDGRITDVNAAVTRATGVPREQLIGSDFAGYFTDPEKARDGYRQVLGNGDVTEYPLTLRHRDGRLAEVLCNANVFKDIDGRVLGVFAVAHDVTARHQMEEELAEQRRRELDRLAELEKFQKLTIGRELKMVELKKELESLKKELDRTGTGNA